jgi:hypothetical protein
LQLNLAAWLAAMRRASSWVRKVRSRAPGAALSDPAGWGAGFPSQQHPPIMIVGPTVTMAWPPMGVPAAASSVSSDTSQKKSSSVRSSSAVLWFMRLPSSLANAAFQAAFRCSPRCAGLVAGELGPRQRLPAHDEKMLAYKALLRLGTRETMRRRELIALMARDGGFAWMKAVLPSST